MLKRLIPFLILAVGVGLAGAFGARNGDQHSAYRTANQAVGDAAAHQSALDGGLALVDGRATVPQAVAQSLRTATEADGSGGAASAVAEADAALEAAGEDPGDTQTAALVAALTQARDQAAARTAAATKARDEIGLPPPGERLAQWGSVGGLGWLLGVVLIVVGALVARRQIAEQQAGGGADTVAADFPGTVRRALQVVDEVDGLIAELQMDDDGPEARDKIDELVAMYLGPLVDARGQLIARHGLAAFAMYFGPFSGGERNLARTWSALTDGHAPEARSSLQSARQAFEEALGQWDAQQARERVG